MERPKIIKLVILNLVIGILNVVLFSKGLMNIQILGSSAFETAFGITAILLSIAFFAVGNLSIVNKKVTPIPKLEIKSHEDCILVLQNSRSKTFEKDIRTILVQSERFMKKKITIQEILLQKFSMGEMSYSKFNGAVLDVENVFYINIKSILNRLNAFDEVDYNLIKHPNANRKFSNEVIQSKLAIYKEYIDFVSEAIEDNEEILLKLDKLLLEISKFNSLEDGEIEQMVAMKEIDELINKTKYYK